MVSNLPATRTVGSNPNVANPNHQLRVTRGCNFVVEGPDNHLQMFQIVVFLKELHEFDLGLCF